MKKGILLAILVFLAPLPLMADEFRALLDESDALMQRGLQHVAEAKTADLYLKAFTLAAKAADMQPNSYEANWKATQRARCYCGQIKWFMTGDWRKECARVSRLGMKYAQRAIELEPRRVEGHFWYASLLGSYSDGVSIVTAFKEGIKNKVQTAMETSYRIDPAYWDHSIYLALGEFWYLLPWPLKNSGKARDFLEKYMQRVPASADNIEEGWYFLGKILLESKDAKSKERGRQYLTKAANGRFPYFSRAAKEELS